MALTHDHGVAPAPYNYYLAEGATVSGLNTHIAIANPGAADATAVLRFLGTDGSVLTTDVAVPAFSRRTVNVGDVAGMESAEFATRSSRTSRSSSIAR